MNEDRFTKIQDLLDRACVKATEKYEIDFSLSNPTVDEAHRKVVDLMFQCADEKVSLDEVKESFQEWVGHLKTATDALILLKAKTLRYFSEPRKCYSLGCPGLVRYSAGKGVCPTCGLSQAIVAVREGLVCTSINYSESETTQTQPSKVLSLATYKKNRKGSGSEKSRNEASLF